MMRGAVPRTIRLVMLHLLAEALPFFEGQSLSLMQKMCINLRDRGKMSNSI
jgi:hypothetical protein